jgi:hypothetical protein
VNDETLQLLHAYSLVWWLKDLMRRCSRRLTYNVIKYNQWAVRTVLRRSAGTTLDEPLAMVLLVLVSLLLVVLTVSSSRDHSRISTYSVLYIICQRTSTREHSFNTSALQSGIHCHRVHLSYSCAIVIHPRNVMLNRHDLHVNRCDLKLHIDQYFAR